LLNIGTTREIIILGDFNGHTGTKVNNQVVGLYGETRINDNGERLIDLCESHNLRIMNGYFKHRMIHKYMSEQHTRKLKSIIDYIIVKQKSKFQIHDVRVQRGINCGSDHYELKCTYQYEEEQVIQISMMKTMKFHVSKIKLGHLSR